MRAEVSGVEAKMTLQVSLVLDRQRSFMTALAAMKCFGMGVAASEHVMSSIAIKSKAWSI